MYDIPEQSSGKLCQECGARIFFVTTTRAPVSVLSDEAYPPSKGHPGRGENHFDVCPNPREYRKSDQRRG